MRSVWAVLVFSVMLHSAPALSGEGDTPDAEENPGVILSAEEDILNKEIWATVSLAEEGEAAMAAKWRAVAEKHLARLKAEGKITPERAKKLELALNGRAASAIADVPKSGDQMPVVRKPGKVVPKLVLKDPPVTGGPASGEKPPAEAAGKMGPEEEELARQVRAATILGRAGELKGASEHLLRARRAYMKALEADPGISKKAAAKYRVEIAELEKMLGNLQDGAKSKTGALKDLKVGGVVLGGGRSRAVINGRVCKEGAEVLPGIKLIKIERGALTFDTPDGQVVLPVRGTEEKPKRNVRRGRKREPVKGLSLDAVVVSDTKRKAVVNGKLVSEGDEVSEGVRVVKIEKNAVTFDVNGETVVKRR